jgi:hypothetical protein
MATPSINFPLTPIAQEAVGSYVRSALTTFYADNTIRERLREVDINYARSNIQNQEHIQSKFANKFGDKYKLQNVTVPVVMPQVESGVAYLSEVFLQGTPMFAMSAEPEMQHIALQYNAIIEKQQRKGAWIAEFVKFFRDGLKYNLCGLEVSWEQEMVTSVETDTSYTGGVLGKKTEVLWAGNRLKRLDMYNTFFDPRVPVSEMHTRGEFVGTTVRITGMELRRLMKKLNVTGSKQLYDSGYKNYYYVPEIMTDVTRANNRETNWNSFLPADLEESSQGRAKYRSCYDLTTVYAWIVPADLKIYNAPAKTTPQIWRFLVINGCEVIWAERMTNAHNYLGMVLAQPINDGLNLQTQSFAENIQCFQDISTALWNAKLNSARRRLTDRMLYDPLRISAKDINSPEPNAKIPVRSGVLGKPIADAVYNMPFDDSNSQFFMQEAEAVINMSFLASGQNRTSQGQFQKGNKTLFEFNKTVAQSELRQQLMALFIQDEALEPVKEMLKLNILQYQPEGEIYSTAQQTTVVIEPLQMRKVAAEFIMSDGLSPTAKDMGTEEFQVAMQTIQAVPQLTAGYEVVPMFSYIMQLRGLKDLSDFEKHPLQLQFETMQQNWQQVAIEAIRSGQPAPPQPQMPPELVAHLQMKQTKKTTKNPFELDRQEDAEDQPQQQLPPL